MTRGATGIQWIKIAHIGIFFLILQNFTFNNRLLQRLLSHPIIADND